MLTVESSPEEGILALWRLGQEDLDISPFPPDVRRLLHVVGHTGVKMALRGAVAWRHSVHFEPGPLDERDREVFLTAAKVTDIASRQGITVHAVVYEDMSSAEVNAARMSLKSAMAILTADTRGLAGITDPAVDAVKEAARIHHTGAVFMPPYSFEVINSARALAGLGIAEL